MDGWTELEKGGEKKDGAQILGAWENDDKTIRFGVTWFSSIPDFGILVGAGQIEDEILLGIDPLNWPKKAELLGEDHFGLRIEFKPEMTTGDEVLEHFWVYGLEGGVMFVIYRKAEVSFPIKDWLTDGLPASRDEDKLHALHDTVTRIKGADVHPRLSIDPEETSEEIGKRLKRVAVRIGSNGSFFYEGEKVTDKELRIKLAAAARKFEKEKEVPEIQLSSIS